jgi:hypothetical protein
VAKSSGNLRKPKAANGRKRHQSYQRKWLVMAKKLLIESGSLARENKLGSVISKMKRNNGQ